MKSFWTFGFSDSIAYFSIFYIEFQTFFFHFASISIWRFFSKWDILIAYIFFLVFVIFWFDWFFFTFWFVLPFVLSHYFRVLFLSFKITQSKKIPYFYNCVIFFFLQRKSHFLVQNLIFYSFNFRVNDQIFLARKFKHFSVFQIPKSRFSQKKMNFWTKNCVSVKI